MMRGIYEEQPGNPRSPVGRAPDVPDVGRAKPGKRRATLALLPDLQDYAASRSTFLMSTG